MKMAPIQKESCRDARTYQGLFQGHLKASSQILRIFKDLQWHLKHLCPVQLPLRNVTKCFSFVFIRLDGLAGTAFTQFIKN